MKFTRFDVYLCLAALVSSVVIGVAYLDSGQREILKQVQELRARSNGQPTAAQPAKPQLPPLPDKISIANAAIRGSQAARAVMVEFSDFQCPYCGRYTRDTLPQIQKAYVDSGKIQYVWRNNPLPPQAHPQALEAGEAGECARLQGKFWPMHDGLYANQDKFGGDFNALLATLAVQAGLDRAAFATCMTTPPVAKIRADQQDAAQAGASGTPYFFFGVQAGNGDIKVTDRIVEGAVPFDRFKAVLDKLLAGAR